MNRKDKNSNKHTKSGKPIFYSASVWLERPKRRMLILFLPTISWVGIVNKDLTLKDREWTCIKCNTKHDRDINAAVNIKNFALRNYVSGPDTKTRNELPTLVGVLTSEAQPIGSAVGG